MSVIPSPQVPQDHDDGFWDSVPVWSKYKELVSFFATRKAILAGTPLYDLSKAELKAADLMDPWKFNIVQSAFAAAPTLALTILAAYFFPPHEVSIWKDIPYVEKIHAALEALTVPFSLFLTVYFISRASLHRQDQTAPNRRRVQRVYLYMDGAFGLYSQAYGALLYNAWLTLERIPLDDNPKLGLAGLCFFPAVVIIAWQGWLTLRTVPSRIFAAHGYSAEIGDPDDHLQAPWGKYRLTALLVVPAIGYSVKALLWLVALAIGLVLTPAALSATPGPGTQ